MLILRILQVSSQYYPAIGGLEEHVKNICERIAKIYDITVATTDPTGILPKEENINNVKVIRFKSWAPGCAYHYSSELQRYLKRNCDSFDLVHAHNYHSFPALYAARAKTNNRLIITPHYHGTGHTILRKLLHIPYKRIGKQIFDKSDEIICVSRFEQNLLLKNFKINPAKTHVIPNGVNIDDFKGITKRKKKYRTILFVGRLEKYKGVQNIIQALPKIDKDIILEIVGTGPFETNLVKLTSYLHLGDRVTFLKDLTRNELIQRYVNADLFVLLSEHESYGICIGEALTAGTPCLVANTSALSEWIDNENCIGITYPIDLNELVCLIQRFIGKSTIKKEIVSWDEVVNNLVRLYEKNFNKMG